MITCCDAHWNSPRSSGASRHVRSQAVQLLFRHRSVSASRCWADRFLPATRGRNVLPSFLIHRSIRLVQPAASSRTTETANCSGICSVCRAVPASGRRTKRQRPGCIVFEPAGPSSRQWGSANRHRCPPAQSSPVTSRVVIIETMSRDRLHRFSAVFPSSDRRLADSPSRPGGAGAPQRRHQPGRLLLPQGDTPSTNRFRPEQTAGQATVAPATIHHRCDPFIAVLHMLLGAPSQAVRRPTKLR